MTAKQLILSIAAIVVFLCAPYVTTPSFAADPTSLYKAGMEAYNKPDFVDALKYLFAYQVVAEKAIDADPKGKKELEMAIAYCERKLRESVTDSIHQAAIKKGFKIGGVIKTNPWEHLDRFELEKSLKSGVTEKNQ